MAENNNVDVSSVMAQAVNKLVERKVEQAPYDKTYSGIISDILFEPSTEQKDIKFGTYKVRYGNGMEKIFRINDNILHEIGERVKVYVPENNPSRMYVEPVVEYLPPYKIVYDKDKITFTEYRKIKTKDKEYEISSEYKIEVKNKDTADEEVTKMILPDGREILFENWDI